MKIYRYMYRNNEYKKDCFEYEVEIVRNGYYIKELYKCVFFKECDKLSDSNYIMWSLKDDLDNKFIDLVIEKKNEMMIETIKLAKNYKREIERLEKEKVVYNEKEIELQGNNE